MRWVMTLAPTPPLIPGVPPITGRRVVDFGAAGRRETFLYNLPETHSIHSILGVPTVSARFGTSPGIWNGAMALLARTVPREKLQQQSSALAMARMMEPLVRLVDAAVGERTAMRVDVEFGAGNVISGRFVHNSLAASVGACLGAFALDLLATSDKVSPGARFPEEAGALVDARLLLQRASQGCLEFTLGKASWQLESKATQLGFGLYFE